MQKVIRTFHGSSESVEIINKLLADNWRIVSSTYLPQEEDAFNYYRSAVEYVIEKDGVESEKSA